MKLKYWLFLALSLLILFLAGNWIFNLVTIKSVELILRNPSYKIGDSVDSFNGVVVFYNGSIGNVSGRNLTKDKYNLGQKYQCVEFVKRYYYQHFNHKMPDSYGHAKDFFDKSVLDGARNKKRDLNQYTNPSRSKPKVDDLVIFDGTSSNKFGHVAIITEVTNDHVAIIQQNPGPYSSSRAKYDLIYKNNLWYIDNARVLGWLRMVR